MTRILYIIRGLPSAGKTTLAEQLAPDRNISLDECRAQLAPVLDGSDNDWATVKRREQDIVANWMRGGATPIAVHDVNARRSDVTDWILRAVEHGYQWAVVCVETDLTDYELAARSKTECPVDAIAKARQRWQPWRA